MAEAVSLLKQSNGDGLIVAGGHSLIPMMKLRLARPSALIDLAAIDSLKGIEISADEISIGAMMTQHEIIHSESLARACPILRETALHIADPQVRYCGTLGGNAANGDPGNDMPAVMVAVNASYALIGGSGERRIAAREYYQGAYFTARAEDEILTAIHIPIPPAAHGFAYEKQKRKIGDYATAAAAVVLSKSGGKIDSVDIALTNLSETPLLATAAAERLSGSSGDDADIAAAASMCADICEPAQDQRGPAEFRKYLASVLVGRAIRRALAV